MAVQNRIKNILPGWCVNGCEFFGMTMVCTIDIVQYCSRHHLLKNVEDWINSKYKTKKHEKVTPYLALV